MGTDASLQSEFDGHFSAFRQVPIAVYGTGKNAGLVLKHIRGYDFFALVSADHAGGMAYGKDIITIEEAIERAGMILVAAIPSSASIIYARIKDTVPQGLPVYDMRGQKLNGDEYYKDNAYWEKRPCNLYRLIDRHEVVSFDVFDTLVMRKVLRPSDVFLLVENEIRKKGQEIPFAAWRIEAEEKAARACCPTVGQIYRAMKELHGLGKECIREWEQMEIGAELELVCRRNAMAEFLDYAYQKGKKIYLTTDMYLPGEVLRDMLGRCGIRNYHELLVSCENNASKENGTLYQVLKRKEKGKKILHIGDNYKADVGNAESNGLDAFWVMSGYDILAASSIAYVIEEAKSLDEKRMLGCFVTDMLDDPFVLNASQGKVQLDTYHGLAHCFTPITALFLGFIKEKGRQYDFLLFASRDGYFLERLYRMAPPSGNIPDNGTKPIYFYASRSAVNRSVISDEADLYTVCSKLAEDPQLDVRGFLRTQFGIEADDGLAITAGQAVRQWGEDGLWERILPYKECIVKISSENREKYCKYIDGLGLNASCKAAVVDIVTQGTLVHGLSRLIGAPVDLIALGTSAMPNGYVQDMGRVSSVYGNINQNMDGTAYSLSDFSELHLFLEVVYASCEGQFVGFDENGKVITLDNEYDCGLVLGIQHELENMMEGNGFFSGWEISKEFALSFLRILYSKNSDMAEGIRERFRFKDPYDSNRAECNLMECIG